VLNIPNINTPDPDALFMPPRVPFKTLDRDECNQIGKHLSTRLTVEPLSATANTAARRGFEVNRSTVFRFLPLAVSQWGKLKIEGGGDTVHAANVVHRAAEDSRDASYVRVSVYSIYSMPSTSLACAPVHTFGR